MFLFGKYKSLDAGVVSYDNITCHLDTVEVITNLDVDVFSL